MGDGNELMSEARAGEEVGSDSCGDRASSAGKGEEDGGGLSVSRPEAGRKELERIAGSARPVLGDRVAVMGSPTPACNSIGGS